MKIRSLTAPSLRVERPVGRRAGRSTPPFSSTTKPPVKTPGPAEVIDRLRESLSRIEKERRGFEQSLLDLLDSGGRPGPSRGRGAAEQRYRRFLRAELEGANLALEELVVNLSEVLGKEFRARFLKRAQADLAAERVDRDY